ncbi:alpha/beta fold hydrolase [Rhodococcus hoagii]|jgi:2-hydroxy-6-oxonona-2,4-dienedioate hydrolase|uniref:Hydrolase, alpha/beta domain protein n=3 Tax=Rhodococcus hoagii TaxID=43767 RepID=E9SWS3_RHOHA|nr:alpha/beta hydrolase [Prescottella equi]MBU4614416.1 alpha/beta hydrolase [Rhodococcus sp. GG48]GBF15632.1 4,5:9,10-diseco-3-hydroxy-5,9, 17-trioxoandrosta-1(10),2-diene-4-oate hydrolase [Rhodococcus sp. Br-6]EGD26019.1 hydrolase, alpha/beta domain protein [Prescottella equi ATCC 33707]ERN43936.1 alpha/beta hydrolase [Prescottella equi NBRC 101255 = C 7]MBM4469506.1 alpha/beta fold hydrolase [Prescottella equi]
MTIWNELAGIDFAVKTVDAAGIPTRSLQAGSGDEAVVFLHGTSGHLEAFARNIAVHAAHYECHAIDMLGHGYTGKPDYAYEIPRYVEHLVNYLDAVGLDKVHLVGESLGGWVAAHLASEQPERVLSLQLLAAGGTVANPEIMERIRTSTTKAVQSDDVELTRARLRLLMHDPVDATEELVEARHRIYHQPDFVANIHNLLSLQDMETRQRNLLRPDRLARIQAPTLVVWGHENPFGDVPEAKKMAEDIPGAQLQLYPECGHWPQHEQAALYNPLSLEFLAKASAHARSVA